MAHTCHCSHALTSRFHERRSHSSASRSSDDEYVQNAAIVSQFSSSSWGAASGRCVADRRFASWAVTVSAAMPNSMPSRSRPSMEVVTLNVATPATFPQASTIGPPLLPGLIAASVWSTTPSPLRMDGNKENGAYFDTIPLVVDGVPTTPGGNPTTQTPDATVGRLAAKLSAATKAGGCARSKARSWAGRLPATEAVMRVSAPRVGLCSRLFRPRGGS